MNADSADRRRCTKGTSRKPEQVTVTFDPEDAISAYGAIRNVICPGNLAAVGYALIAYGKQVSDAS
jgi:hypothetical protein